MNKEHLISRRDEYVKQQMKLAANITAFNGAIEAITVLINEFDTGDESTPAMSLDQLKEAMGADSIDVIDKG